MCVCVCHRVCDAMAEFSNTVLSEFNTLFKNLKVGSYGHMF